MAAALDGGDVACIQLRLKDVLDDDIRRACDILRPVAQDRDVAFLMNDRADLAAELGCDGVHIGQEDTPLHTAAVGNMAAAVKTLLDIGCDPTVTNAKGETPLAVARRVHRDDEITSLLTF